MRAAGLRARVRMRARSARRGGAGAFFLGTPESVARSPAPLARRGRKRPQCSRRLPALLPSACCGGGHRTGGQTQAHEITAAAKPAKGRRFAAIADSRLGSRAPTKGYQRMGIPCPTDAGRDARLRPSARLEGSGLSRSKGSRSAPSLPSERRASSADGWRRAPLEGSGCTASPPKVA